MKDSAGTEATALKELLEFQTSSVVSRTLESSKCGSVTAFAFDVGQELSEHTAPFDAIVVGVEGEAGIKISGKTYRLHEGEMIKMPANEPHSLSAITKFKMLLIMIRA